MNETTTTEDQPFTNGEGILEDETSEPEQVEATESAAGEPTEDTQTDPQGTDESVDVPADTDENLEWLKSKGISPDDPDFNSKVAAAYRNAEKQMHTATEKAKQSLQKGIEPAPDEYTDPGVFEMQLDLAELRFYSEHPEAKGHEADLIAVSKDYPELGQAFNLKAMWEIAQARNAKSAIKEAETRGRQAAKAELARTSTATTPKGNASSAAPAATEEASVFDKTWDSYD